MEFKGFAVMDPEKTQYRDELDCVEIKRKAISLEQTFQGPLPSKALRRLL